MKPLQVRSQRADLHIWLYAGDRLQLRLLTFFPSLVHCLVAVKFSHHAAQADSGTSSAESQAVPSIMMSSFLQPFCGLLPPPSATEPLTHQFAFRVWVGPPAGPGHRGTPLRARPGGSGPRARSRLPA